MEQDSKYFIKTAEALKNLRQTAELLSIDTSEAIDNKIRLQAQIASLRQAIYEKSDHVNAVIEKLRGALQ